MDTLTHALSGALIARVAAPDGHSTVTTRDCVALGFFSAAFPDADVVLSLASPLAYLYLHRGVTHSVLLLPLWALMVAWLWSRIRANRPAMPVYFLISILAIGIHILGDLITSFGTMIFSPFSDARIELGTTFIIDPWFSGILLAGLAAAWAFRHSRMPAIVGLAVLCGYVGFQWIQKSRAIELGAAYASEQGLANARVNALPRPVSPFNWMLIVADADRYHYTFVNLRRDRPLPIDADAGLVARLDAPYQPIAAARWQSIARMGDGDARPIASKVWTHPRFAFFRWFAAFPVLARIEQGNPSRCVWFRDLRFLTPGRDAWPFQYGMCMNGRGEWEAYERGDNDARIPLGDDRASHSNK